MACSKRVRIGLSLGVLTLIVLGVVVAVVVVLLKNQDDAATAPLVYKNGAVASDSPTCSKIGVEILQANGSAMDAAIATLFALGVVHPHSSGIGGGGFMLVYERASKQAKYFDFRESAPAAATPDMFKNRTEESKKGVHSVAVPTEVPAMYKAWQMYGKLPWKRLVEPAINLAANGFEIDEALSIVLKTNKDDLLKEKGFREVFYDAQGTPRKQGDIVKDRVFADTLREISKNPLSMYNGSLATEIARDIQERGGNMTVDDLKMNVTVIEREVLVSSMSDDDTLYTTSAPSSGATLILILNILKGFNFSPDSLSTANVIQTWHTILEAFKFGFAYRPYLGDPDFNPEVKKSEKVQTNASYAAELRRKIWANSTHDSLYYGGFYRNEPDFGTTHVSVLGPNGDAVSVTSTLGWFFGAKIRSYKTGIVYNNHMSTFSLPNTTKIYQPKPSRANYIAPGKHSVSTACPTIVVYKDGSVKMVVGASGGLRITSGVPTVLMNKLWFNLTMKQSINQPRLHHQLYPNHFTYEEKTKYRMSEDTLRGLRALGHNSTGLTRYCAVQGVYRDKGGNIFAMSDPRKAGKAAGY